MDNPNIGDVKSVLKLYGQANLRFDLPIQTIFASRTISRTEVEGLMRLITGKLSRER